MDILDSLAQKGINPNRVLGVYVHLTGNTDVQLSYVELRKEKGRVMQVSSAELIRLEQFCQLDIKSIPICLNIAGKGILHKKLQTQTDKDALEEVLPYGKKEEFYYSILDEGAHTFVSVGRQEVVDKVLQEFRENNLLIASVQLGFSAILTILPFVRAQEIFLPQIKLLVQDGNINDFSISQAAHPNRIGEEAISSTITLPYAHALQLLLKETDQAETNLQIRDEWFQRELYKKLMIGVLGFFFSLLLANFFILSNLSSVNSDLLDALGQNQFQLKRLAQLEKQVSSQQSLYQTLGLGKQNFITFYADRLASSIGNNSIRLKKLEIHPLVTNKSRSLRFEKDTIFVRGSCNEPLEINSWLEQLEREEWVQEIRNRKYVKQPQSGEGEFSFELTVKAAW